jgi:hypothetical protein
MDWVEACTGLYKTEIGIIASTGFSPKYSLDVWSCC